MKLHFEPDLDYQLQAIEAVCGLYRGREVCRTEFTVTHNVGSAQTQMAFEQSDLDVGNRLTLLDMAAPFHEVPSLARQPRTHLYRLYQRWIDIQLVLLAARIKGVFGAANTPEQVATRHEALRERAPLDAELARLRSETMKENQVHR
jgi:hypothetical protein